MRRGDIWTVADGRDYVGKPRPVVSVQDDSFDAFTTGQTEARLFRLPVEPNDRNGPLATSRLMVDRSPPSRSPRSVRRSAAWTTKISCASIRRFSSSSGWPTRPGRGSRDRLLMGLHRARL